MRYKGFVAVLYNRFKIKLESVYTVLKWYLKYVYNIDTYFMTYFKSDNEDDNEDEDDNGIIILNEY